MSSLNVLQYPHKGLREIARPVVNIDDALRQQIQAMFNNMYEDTLVGFAATQIGLPLRFFVMDVSRQRNQGICFINPEIIRQEGESISEEGCASFPGVYTKVKRAAHVTVRYQDLDGQVNTIDLSHLGAHCAQHEIEHLDGILMIDHLSKLKRHLILKKYEKNLRAATHE